jgi:hypothetical protein
LDKAAGIEYVDGKFKVTPIRYIYNAAGDKRAVVTKRSSGALEMMFERYILDDTDGLCYWIAAKPKTFKDAASLNAAVAQAIK